MFSRSKKKPKAEKAKLVISMPTPIAPIKVNGPYIDLRPGASASTPALSLTTSASPAVETKSPVALRDRAAKQTASAVSGKETGWSSSAPSLVMPSVGEDEGQKKQETRGGSGHEGQGSGKHHARERQVAAFEPIAAPSPVSPLAAHTPLSFNFSRKMLRGASPAAASAGPAHSVHVTPGPGGRSDSDDMNNIRGRPREQSLKRQQRPDLRIEPNYLKAPEIEAQEAKLHSASSSLYSSRESSPAREGAVEAEPQQPPTSNQEPTPPANENASPETESPQTVVTIVNKPDHLRHLRQYSDSPTIGLESPEISPDTGNPPGRRRSPPPAIPLSPIDQRLEQLGQEAFDLQQLLSPVGTVRSGESLPATDELVDDMKRPSISAPHALDELPSYLGQLQDLPIPPSPSESDKPKRSLSRKMSQKFKGLMGAKKEEGKITKNLISKPIPISDAEKEEALVGKGGPVLNGQDAAAKIDEWNYAPSVASKAPSLQSSGPSLVSLASISNNPGLSSHPSSLHSYERGPSPPSPVSPITPAEGDYSFDTIRGPRLGQTAKSEKTIRSRDTSAHGEEVPVFLDTSSEVSVPSMNYEPPTPRKAEFDARSRSGSVQSRSVRSGSVSSEVNRSRAGSIAQSEFNARTRSPSIVPSEPEAAEPQEQSAGQFPSMLDDGESFLRPRVAPNITVVRHARRDSSTSSHSSRSARSVRSSRSNRSSRSLKSPITAPSSVNPSPLPSPMFAKNSRFSTASRSTMRSTGGPKLLRSNTMSSRSNGPIRRPTTGASLAPSPAPRQSESLSPRRPSYMAGAQDEISVVSGDEISVISARHRPSPLSQNFPDTPSEADEPPSPTPFDVDRSVVRTSAMPTASSRPSLRLSRSFSHLRTSKPALARASTDIRPQTARLTLKTEFSESSASLASSVGPFDLEQQALSPQSPTKEAKRAKSLGSLRRAFSKRSTTRPPPMPLTPSPTPPLEDLAEETSDNEKDKIPPLPTVSQASLARWNTVRNQAATIRKLTALAPPPMPAEPVVKAKPLTEEELRSIARMPGTIFLKTEIGGVESKHQLKPRKGDNAGKCAFCKRGPLANMWLCEDRDKQGSEKCSFACCRMCANEKVQAGEAELF